MDYTSVTETPGSRITREALSMIYTRYAHAASLCAGKDVLEVACGAGFGLGYLARNAAQVIGGDYSEELLGQAHGHYGNRTPLVRLDAHLLPFRDRSFDVVILYEAIYYLTHPEMFLDESRRVLRDQGILLICTINREWPDFNPSPFSTKYLSARELEWLLLEKGFRVGLFGAFVALGDSRMDRVVSLLKRTAISLHLMPKTMKGKQVLKRLFLGELRPVPVELTDGMAELSPLVPLTPGSVVSNYKVLYAIGRTQ
jgi:ubiquinone/menaquinone biosynthesis C-methylase UbiE